MKKKIFSIVSIFMCVVILALCLTSCSGPGNDMNSTRYKEFCQFIEAGYPVVIADTFIKVDNNNIPVASTATLDKNSYFYKLVDFALQKDANGQYLYWQKNIFTERVS